MKNLKNTIIALSMILCAHVAIGMEREQALQSQSSTEEYMVLPADLRMEINKIVAGSESSDEALKSIRKLTLSNKRFSDLINKNWAAISDHVKAVK